MFTYSTSPRGSVVHAAALAEALQAAGFATTLYALDKTGKGFYRPVQCALELVPAEPARGRGDELIRQRIGELQRFVDAHALRHDIYHTQDCLTANALLACEGLNAPVVRTVHHVEAFQSAYLSACQERSILNSQVLCAVSQMTSNDVRGRFGREAAVVGNGVDVKRTERVEPASVERERKQLLGASMGPLVVSFGGVEWRKNSHRQLEAFCLLKQRFPDAVWVIAGGATVLDHDHYREAFEVALRSSRVARDVIQLGEIDEPRVGVLLCAADVLLSPSLQEGFGLSALEAAAAGVPFVVSRGAPFEEHLDERSTFFADPTDAADIADAAIQALERPWARQLSARAVACRQTWRDVAHRTARLYARTQGEL
jgi:glycosyltransferase-like protein